MHYELHDTARMLLLKPSSDCYDECAGWDSRIQPNWCANRADSSVYQAGSVQPTETVVPTCIHGAAEALRTLAFVPASVVGQRSVCTCGSLPHLNFCGFHAYPGRATSDASQLSIGIACATIRIQSIATPPALIRQPRRQPTGAPAAVCRSNCH